jgi:hypothetical protein
MESHGNLDLMEKLVEDADDPKKSILFASRPVLIRNASYFIISKAISVRLSSLDYYSMVSL